MHNIQRNLSHHWLQTSCSDGRTLTSIMPWGTQSHLTLEPNNLPVQYRQETAVLLPHSVVSIPGLSAVFLHLPIPPSFLPPFTCAQLPAGYVSLQVIFHPFQTPSPVYWVVVHTVTLKQGRRCSEELDVGSPSCSWGSTQVRWSIYALSNSKADHFFTWHLQNNRPRITKYHSY